MLKQACKIIWYSCGTMKVQGESEADPKLSLCPVNVQGLTEKTQQNPTQWFSWNKPEAFGCVEGIWINGLAECSKVEALSRNSTMLQKCLS